MKADEKEAIVIISVNGKEVWGGPWWKVWMRARALVKQNVDTEMPWEITIRSGE